MTRTTIGVGFTLLAVVLTLVVAFSGRDDWWGGPAICGVMVVLYWSLESVLFDGSST